MDLKINIYVFHRVSPAWDPLWHPMTPRLFEKILKHLSKKYEVVPLEKTLLSEYQPQGKKPLCAITFDDGYKDYVDYALPLLQRYGLPSSLYVVTDCAEYGLPPWTYILNHLFINTSHLSLKLTSRELPPELQKTTWKNSKERLAYARNLSPFMKQLNNQERKLIYNEILSEFNDTRLPERMMMSWDEIREVRHNGCEIGSHSKTHPLLTKKVGYESLLMEVLSSGKKIEAETGVFPRTFSYPFGNYNRQIANLTAEAGYKFGVAVNNRQYRSKSDSIMEIPRIELYNEPYYKSLLRIRGILQSTNRFLGRERKFT